VEPPSHPPEQQQQQQQQKQQQEQQQEQQQKQQQRMQQLAPEQETALALHTLLFGNTSTKSNPTTTTDVKTEDGIETFSAASVFAERPPASSGSGSGSSSSKGRPLPPTVAPRDITVVNKRQRQEDTTDDDDGTKACSQDEFQRQMDWLGCKEEEEEEEKEEEEEEEEEEDSASERFASERFAPSLGRVIVL
jgi:hypothetical protein